jgi:Domain of unknown function (DUF4868)
VADSITNVLDQIQQKINNDQTSLRMYLIEDTKKKEHRFILYTLDIEGKVVNEVKDTLSTSITQTKNGITDNEVINKDFYDLNYSSSDISVLKRNDVPNLEDVLSRMQKFTDITSIHDLTKIRNFHAYAIEIDFYDSDTSKVVYFRKIGKSMLLTQTRFIKLFYKKSRFNDLKADILLLDKGVDCIYSESEQLLFVLKKRSTEDIFRLESYYENHAKTVLEDLSKLVIVDEDLLRAILSKKRLIRKITNLSKNNKFNLGIKAYEKYVPYFEQKNKALQNKINFSIINNKILIDGEETFKVFLNICEDNYLESTPSKFSYVSSRKELLR